jgi:predicted acylesterase/phospholipase RssA
MSAIEKANKPAPHKMLACDGGGIRGVLSVEIIAEIESLLQQALGKDDSFVLADYFDHFAGTSTGAIIAACLAIGMRADQIRAQCFGLARHRARERPKIGFGGSHWRSATSRQSSRRAEGRAEL